MARHPKYSIYQVETKDDKETITIASKELMYKCDAERVCNWWNAHNQIRESEYSLWWGVMEYESAKKLIAKEAK